MRAFTDPDAFYSGDYDSGGYARLWYHSPAATELERVPIVNRHSPNGLAWGYTGNGAADTALSILGHATTSQIADTLYQQFKHDVIAQLPLNQAFRLPMERVATWARSVGITRASEREPPLRSSRRIRNDLGAALDDRGRYAVRLRQSAGGDPLMKQMYDDNAAEILNLKQELADAERRQSGYSEVPAANMVAPEAELERWSRLWQRQADLTEREHRLDQREMRLDARALALESEFGMTPSWSAPAEPIRVQMRWLVTETGDPLPTVAKGLDVEPEWAAGVLDGTIDHVDVDHIQRICEALHCNPYDLWGSDVGRSLLHCYGPELWPHEMDALPGGYRDWDPPDNGPQPPDAPPAGPPPPGLGW